MGGRAEQRTRLGSTRLHHQLAGTAIASTNAATIATRKDQRKRGKRKGGCGDAPLARRGRTYRQERAGPIDVLKHNGHAAPKEADALHQVGGVHSVLRAAVLQRLQPQLPQMDEGLFCSRVYSVNFRY